MSPLSKLARMTVDFALPVRCGCCGTIVPDSNTLCLECWTSLEFLTGPGCARCNLPMTEEGSICAPCLAAPPAHDGVSAAVAYNEPSRALVLRLKYGRKVGLARFMGGLMARLMPDDQDWIVTPVPLHRWRIWSRGFNQSLLLGKVMAKSHGRQMIPDLIVRNRATMILGGLGAKERARAVAGAFTLNPKTAALVKGRHIALIDDVYTSGATANACAKVLKRGGAASVRVICWARVLRAN